MNSFYRFYIKNNGRLSRVGMDLIDKADYENAIIHYESLINHFGSISSLGMGDAVAYLHSKFAIGQVYASALDFPEPITKNEIHHIYEYEHSEERLVKNSLIDRRGFLSIPFGISKAILASKIGVDYGCTTVIETGTYLGYSTYLFSGIFEKVETIEADELLYKSSSYWLNRLRQNINTHNGNSGEKLSSILSENKSRALIFLDAHWSGGITTQKHGICPLIDELKLIFSFSNEHIVVVDDIRCMDSPGYPNFKQIFDCVPFGKKITIEHDTMIIV
jgi:hypothetical protein